MEPTKSKETFVDLSRIPVNNLLSVTTIPVIEAALRKVSPFGEVHLIVERGRLRFVRTLKSEAINQFISSESSSQQTSE